jgi:hypothetical protein
MPSARRPHALAATLAATLAVAAAAPRAHAQGAGAPDARAAAAVPDADRDAVRRAVLDYVEGFYEGDSTKLLRSVSPAVRKSGYHRAHPDSAYRESVMPFPEGFLGYARRVREGRARTPTNARKDVQLLDMQDQTASAKLTAWWGTDYLLLGKHDGRWMITHVLWQSPPAPAAPR